MKRKIFALAVALVCSVFCFSLFGCDFLERADGNTDNTGDTEEEAIIGKYNEGDVCPEFQFKGYGFRTGEVVSLAEARGKFVILNFWFSTCPPCLNEIPEFERFFEEHSDRLSVFVAHDYESPLEDYNGFLQKRGWQDFKINFVKDVPMEEGKTAYDLLGGYGTFPFTVILDQEGKIVRRFAGGVTYEYLTHLFQPYFNK